jgi:cell division septum initiation protein DivIVA
MAQATYTTEHLTPRVAAEASFPQAKFGRRGFDEAQVRAFCAWVADEVAAMHAERTDLEAEVRRLRSAQTTAAAVQHNGEFAEESHIQAVHVLSKAQQTADRYVANAQEYSREIAEDARRRRDELLSEARVRASMILQEAQSRGEHAAELVPAGLAPLTSSQRRDLEAEIAYLRAFSGVCRAHLRAYLESLAKSVEEWERAEESAVTAARLGLAPGA